VIRTAALLCASCVLWIGLCQADDAKTAGFDFHVADGPDTFGLPGKITEDWSVGILGGEGTVGKSGSLISMRRRGQPLPALPIDEHVLFVNGDALPGRVIQLANERLQLDVQLEPLSPSGHNEKAVPLSTVAALWFSAPDGVGDVQRFRRQVVRERRRRDRVFFRNGDRLEGVLTRIEQDAVTLEVDKKAQRLDRERIAVIACNTEFARASRPRGIYGRLVLANGARLSLASAEGDEQTWTGKTLFGASLRIPVEQIVALALLHGRATYLSELKPKTYEHTPYFGLSWPFENDASVTGQDLRLAGSTYDRGIGMHTESRLTYDLEGNNEWFESLAGLDDRAGPAANASVQVLVDGKPAGTADLTGTTSPKPLRVRIAGAHQLTLVAQFGPHGDVQGHVDWAEARLIK
jgi:hypothetical protein